MSNTKHYTTSVKASEISLAAPIDDVADNIEEEPPAKPKRKAASKKAPVKKRKIESESSSDEDDMWTKMAMQHALAKKKQSRYKRNDMVAALKNMRKEFKEECAHVIPANLDNKSDKDLEDLIDQANSAIDTDGSTDGQEKMFFWLLKKIEDAFVMYEVPINGLEENCRKSDDFKKTLKRCQNQMILEGWFKFENPFVRLGIITAGIGYTTYDNNVNKRTIEKANVVNVDESTVNMIKELKTKKPTAKPKPDPPKKIKIITKDQAPLS
jgi:hypothetical protein